MNQIFQVSKYPGGWGGQGGGQGGQGDQQNDYPSEFVLNKKLLAFHKNYRVIMINSQYEQHVEDIPKKLGIL